MKWKKNRGSAWNEFEVMGDCIMLTNQTHFFPFPRNSSFHSTSHSCIPNTTYVIYPVDWNKNLFLIKKLILILF
ncbi:hypothetical protein HanIR_Chr02g0084891 [Helianthus annuus]|nr:hypothetical protein HanIR_Chr02g0084891 [Helianthus annuus]